jgi:hypothetical protein
MATGPDTTPHSHRDDDPPETVRWNGEFPREDWRRWADGFDGPIGDRLQALIAADAAILDPDVALTTDDPVINEVTVGAGYCYFHARQAITAVRRGEDADAIERLETIKEIASAIQESQD